MKFFSDYGIIGILVFFQGNGNNVALLSSAMIAAPVNIFIMGSFSVMFQAPPGHIIRLPPCFNKDTTRSFAILRSVLFRVSSEIIPFNQSIRPSIER